jgi:hypothetical protein
MNTIVIIGLLFLALVILILLNHTNIVVTNTNTNTQYNNGEMVTAYDNIQGTCADTHFGCCPDGVNSKMNIFGSNCAGYKPVPPPPPT